MRIHYDHQVFSLQNTGGNTRYHFELMRHLAAYKGVDIDLFLGLYPSGNLFACHPERSESVRCSGQTRGVEGPLSSDSPITGGPQLRGAPPFRLPLSEGWVSDIGSCESVHISVKPSTMPPGPRRYFINDALNSAFALVHGRYDIYHPTHHRYLPVVRARRLVVTLHDCTQEKFPEEFRYNDRVLRYRDALFARADSIICISETSRQDLLQFYKVDPARTRVIHHGVTRLAPPPDSANCQSIASGHNFSRTEQGLLNEMPCELKPARPYLLYVGSRALYKNFRAFLRSFRDSDLCRDFDLLVLGGGAITADEIRMLEELRLTETVTHVSAVSDSLLAEAYAHSQLLVYPSLSEGFGLPPLEAMDLGCPVLVCNTSCLPEICSDAAFYFEPNSPESLTEALRFAAYDETARALAIQRGHQIASQYSWEKCAEQTLSLYRECL